MPRGLEEDKVFKKVTCNHSQFYPGYLNILVDEYNNAYHHSINKNLIDPDYFSLSKEIEKNPKVPAFKVGDRVKYKNICSKGYAKKMVKRKICEWFCVQD